MARHQHRPQRPYPELSHGDIVHAAGTPVSFAAEADRVPANIDHFWITIGLGTGEPIRISLSTHSRQNAAAGFDARIRVGTVAAPWTELPPAGLEKSPGLDYRAIEQVSAVSYLESERPGLERLLAEKAKRASFIEVWGELYIRTHLGIHQVHSMRASCSVPRDYVGRDGAIRFYFAEKNQAELLLFKYCGQP
jgi:hypothetical protein